MEDTLKDVKKINASIIAELKDISKKYAQPRKTLFLYDYGADSSELEDDTPDYPVHLFLSKSGYFKKITPQSLRMSGENKLKDGDVMDVAVEATNKADLLFFTDKQQCYKSKVSAFDDTKASLLGDYIPAKLGFDEGENVAAMVVTADYEGHLLMAFENGKAAKVPLKSFETKTERKKLVNAYNDKSRLVKLMPIFGNTEILLRASSGRALVFNTGMILPKAARDTLGVQVFTLKGKAVVDNAYIVTPDMEESVKKYTVRNIPSAGLTAKELPDFEQISLI